MVGWNKQIDGVLAMKRFSSIMIILAGIFWGSMGLFVRTFTRFGFTTLQMVALRMVVAAVVLLVTLLIVKKELLKIKLKDLPLLASIGVFSLTAMSIFYFTTIELTTMSVAAVLLYLSPIVVMLLSALIFKDKITPRKLICLCLAVLGCILVSWIGDAGQIGFVGVLTGIGSAISYGLYSILGNIALRKYHPFTIAFWAFATAGVSLLLVCNPVELVNNVITTQNPTSLIWLILGNGIITAVIPYGLYTLGLKYTAPSKAAILACSEPVAATVMGLVWYRETPSLVSVCGMLLVLTAIVLLNLKKQK